MIVVGGLAIVAVASISTTLLVIAVVALIIALGVIGLIASALSGIYMASLYRYATTGNAGTTFHADTIAAAFRSKSGGPAPRYGMPR